jgi:hypothetical protein
MNRTRKHRGGQCPCSMKMAGGSYSAIRKTTYKNRRLLSRLRAGHSIGFTATAHLKAKGLIPRTSKTMRGKKVKGLKYR